MAMIAFYAGLLIGAVAGMVAISLISMIEREESPQEADRR